VAGFSDEQKADEMTIPSGDRDPHHGEATIGRPASERCPQRVVRRTATAGVTIRVACALAAGTALGLVPAHAADLKSKIVKAVEAKDTAPTGIPEDSIATWLPEGMATAGGLRPALARHGVTFQLNYIGEAFSNVSGGIKRGSAYDGRLEAVLDADLEKLMGWTGGTFHMNAFQIHGRSISADYVGSSLAVSNIEATPATRLFELWFEQKLPGDVGSVRAGQLAADSEFITSEYAGLFINGTFGWPGIAADNLINGGPAYPLATPGVRLKLEPNASTALMLAVFNGDPAGRSADEEDPQKLNRHGVSFRTHDDPFIIGEAQFKYAGFSGLPGTVKVGGWFHTGDFDDQRWGADGLALGITGSNGEPVVHKNNYAGYAVIDQQIWHLPGGEPDKGIGVFARIGGSPSDRNRVDFYADAGMNFKGLIAARPDDSFGVAFGYAHISSAARDLVRDLVDDGQAQPVPDYEAVIELTYQAQIAPGWTIQPNFQYIFHPGGNVGHPDDESVPIRNAAVFGVRTQIRY
jgi:porin